MSQPPDYPGRQRLQRVAAAASSDAYQGAFEAIGSVLIAVGFGYWVDSRWDTTPYGLVIGAVIGFAAMVLRLLRLGKELHPDTAEMAGSAAADSDRGVGEAPGLSSALIESPELEDAEDDEHHEDETTQGSTRTSQK